MKISQFYPVLMVSDVAAVAAFYQMHFGFKPLFTADWYVHLQSVDEPAINLAILNGGHESVPQGFRGRTANGMLLNFEVEDVNAVHARLLAQGLPMLCELRDEAFGQRHFITQDPAGTLIDVITPIPPSAEFLDAYMEEAVPR
ncbi:glyoxalase [Stenotrophomonas ginsengisoli]|uniref:Glyoxalase n=1 Tax=Stenotrophomonas ginsengisoli TaxID=336566 RepID=A0A0R0DH72_9GAMM|nr:VOC family protein [Stenotrophomonas ginsengisoli]KRG78082.1 glyoxalase [Stenotrophomonas ginsengisoli]